MTPYAIKMIITKAGGDMHTGIQFHLLNAGVSYS